MEELVKAYISRSALRHNVRLLQKIAAHTPLCAMVKAAAYGHDAALVVKALEGMGVQFWGVATINEAVALRDLNVCEPIIVMRPLTMAEPEKTVREQIRLMRRLEIRPTLVNDDAFSPLAAAAGFSRPLNVHLKVDTGMGRNGCPAEEAAALALKTSAVKKVAIEGVYSHFACAAMEGLDFCRAQLAVFQSVLDGMKAAGINIPLRHMANSGAIFALPEARFDLVRPGKAIYGYGDPAMQATQQLIPVMRVEAPVIFTRWVKKGSACGYDRTFQAQRQTRIGLLPFGYADGYARQWSNAGVVDFRGKLAPVIGRVSMDLTMVDLTDLPEATVGSALCIISNRRADPHSIEALAGQLGTIPHEIGCRLGNRIQRVLTD